MSISRAQRQPPISRNANVLRGLTHNAIASPCIVAIVIYPAVTTISGIDAVEQLARSIHVVSRLHLNALPMLVLDEDQDKGTIPVTEDGPASCYRVVPGAEAQEPAIACGVHEARVRAIAG